MIMKFHVCFILIVLVLHTEARYQEDDLILRNEFNTFLRSLNNHHNSNKQLQTQERHGHSNSLVSPAKKSDSSSSTNNGSDDSGTVEDPARIAIFNAGDFDAHLTVNYIINGIQQEQEILSQIKSGQHRSVFMPITASYIRIRIQKEDALGIFIVDEQIQNLNGDGGFCCVLAHTSSHPVYGICPSTYKAMLKAWGL